MPSDVKKLLENTLSKLATVYGPKMPAVRIFRIRTRWNASSRVHRIGRTTMTRTRIRVGDSSVRPARCSSLAMGESLRRPRQAGG